MCASAAPIIRSLRSTSLFLRNLIAYRPELRPAARSKTPRIYADFNSVGPGDVYWCLRYGPDRRPLDDVATELGLREGMKVTIYHEDSEEEFEVSAVLFREDGGGVQWLALADIYTFRRIRG